MEDELLNKGIRIPTKVEGKIRVLRIINRFNIGGPTYNATFLSRFMGDEYQTLLVGGLPEDAEADSLFILEKYNVEPILLAPMKRKPSIKSDRRAYKALKAIMMEFQPHIVHTHASKAGALGRKAAKSCNVPVIVHTFHGHVFHSYFGKMKTELYRRIEKQLAAYTDRIIAISEIQKRELIDDYHIAQENKFKVVPLGFDLLSFHEARQNRREEQRSKLNLKDDVVAIGIIGRLAPIKDHRFFLDVIEGVLKQCTQKIKVFIVGDGELKMEILNRIEIINKQYEFNPIVFHSWEKDIASFNAAMDIICLTSKNEGTPVSLIEAQASGVPVISTDVGGVRDIVDHQKTGVIVPKRDLGFYTRSLIEMIEDEKKRHLMSQNGWTHVEQKFSYSTLTKNMDALYKELLSEKKVRWK